MPEETKCPCPKCGAKKISLEAYTQFQSFECATNITHGVVNQSNHCLITELRAALSKAVEALKEYRASVRALGELVEQDGVKITHFEASPTRNPETAKRWIQLNDAGKLASAALSGLSAENTDL